MKETRRNFLPEGVVKMANPKNAPKDIGFSNSAPKWRTIDKGLNVFGKCSCNQCVAQNHTVICMKKICTIDLAKDSFECNCPMCGGAIKPITVGFYLCNYKITGASFENEKIENFGPITGKADDKDHCKYFDPSDGTGSYIQYLIETSDL